MKGFRIFNHKILTTIPNGIGNFFANLESFHWWAGNISSVDSSTFRPFPNLLSIQLGDNRIVAVDGDLFQFTLKLQRIYFSGNLLRHVGHDLLTGLADLTYARFESNSCINAIAETPQQIQELSLQLAVQCPPNECPSICMINEMAERITDVERQTSEEAKDMKLQIDKIEKNMKLRIDGLDKQVNDRNLRFWCILCKPMLQSP